MLKVPVSVDNSRYQIQLTSSASHLSNGSGTTTTKLMKRKSESSVGKKSELILVVENYLELPSMGSVECGVEESESEIKY